MEGGAPIFTADFLYEEMINSLNVITTGCSNLDSLLGGGLYSGELTEIYGSPAAGKTQSCLSVACHVASKHNKNVVFVDTAGGFSGDRVKQIMAATNESFIVDMSYENPMTRIQCIKTFDIFSALLALEELLKNLSKEEDAFYQDVVLVILDGVASLISPVLGGMQHHGHALMVSLGRTLKRLASDYNIAVLLTNNVVSDFTSNSYTKPALGKTWSHVPNNRIHLYQNTRNSLQRTMKLTKSCRLLVDRMVSASITEAGLLN